MIIQQLSTDWQLIGDKEVGLWHTLRWLEVWSRQLQIVINRWRCANRSRTTFDAEENFLFRSNVQWIHLRIELLWLVWDQSRSKYYLRTKFQDGIDKPQKCQNVCYHPTHQQQSDFLILVLYDFIVQSILSSLLLLCYNLMIMNDYE